VQYPILIALLTGLFSALGTRLLLPLLRRHVLDVPNARSNHAAPVPRGGGIAMIGAALVGLWVVGLPPLIIGGAVLLALISFLDDLRGMPPLIRLLAQAVTVALALSTLHGRVLPALPQMAEYILLALAWIWYINLTNFMDGIDGISAMQAIMTCAGVCLLHVMKPWIPPQIAAQGAVIAMAAYGFYLFNRSPARLFMGDVGSVPLGFLVGYLLLQLAAAGYLLPALILPAYYVADASWTLLKRLFRRRKIWEAHREHAYQQAVQRGFTHAQVVSRVSWADVLLIGLAMAGSVSMMAGVLSLAAAYLLTFWLIRYFTHGTPPART